MAFTYIDGVSASDQHHGMVTVDLISKNDTISLIITRNAARKLARAIYRTLDEIEAQAVDETRIVQFPLKRKRAR